MPKDAFWVFDSGFDGYNFFRRFDAMGMNYAVRLKLSNDRFLYTPEGDMRVSELVDLLPQTHTYRPKLKRTKLTGSREVLQLGFVRNVRLPLHTPGGRRSREIGDTWYSLVIARGATKEPLVIITTARVMAREDAGRVVDMYLN